MRFYFPDSQDQIDPNFDFTSETHPPFHVRQRDDLYAHEALRERAFTGILVSKTIVDGLPGAAGRYTLAHRHRLYRIGAHRFFRLDKAKGGPMKAMGDCGAFTYVKEDVPSYTVDEVIDFYEGCGFDAGISVDHVILEFRSASGRPRLDGFDEVDTKWKERQGITLELAAEFRAKHKARKCRFEPIGVAQGWDAASYCDSVSQLQKIGYNRIALGGMVGLRTHQILEVLEAVSRVRRRETQFHLLGVTRTGEVNTFGAYGVTSFDSTSPFRRSFKDATNNYYAADKDYTAIRIPQVDGNAKLKRTIKAGMIDQQVAFKLEAKCLKAVRQYDAGRLSLQKAVAALREYEELYDGATDRSDAYTETLEAAPWKACRCGICDQVGLDVIIFRGTERNKRRGFHNIAVFAQRLARDLATATNGAK